MPTEADPLMENWYQHLDKGQKFRVVALNDAEGIVEIQHFDGDVEEIDMDSWYQLDIEPIEAPENWSGAIDVAETDDLGTEITDTTADDWAAPMQEIKPTESTTDQTEAEEEALSKELPKEAFWEGER